MSPNGQKAPPALAATTVLTQAMPTKRGSSLPTAITTAHMSMAVVMLFDTEEMKKARTPVTQNSCR